MTFNNFIKIFKHFIIIACSTQHYPTFKVTWKMIRVYYIWQPHHAQLRMCRPDWLFFFATLSSPWCSLASILWGDPLYGLPHLNPFHLISVCVWLIEAQKNKGMEVRDIRVPLPQHPVNVHATFQMSTPPSKCPHCPPNVYTALQKSTPPSKRPYHSESISPWW